MIRAILVDDEEHALNILNILLDRIGGVEVVGRASNGFDALERLRELRPDVVFLDIEMPGMSGVELAERIGDENLDVQVVFVTAYDRYAISAFERDALDYLLKPLETDRLEKTVQRIQKEAMKLKLSGLAAAETAAADAGVASAAGAAGADRIETPPVLSVRLMGGVEAVGTGNGEERGARMKWRTGKEKELFVLLSLRGKERLHRDYIVDALWPEEHYQKAKVYLHTCVSFLRKDLKALGFTDALKYEGEKYYLRPELLRTDCERFLEAVGEAKAASPDKRKAALERAVALYGGPLLKDEDYVWAEDDIQHLEQAAGEARTLLARQYEADGDYPRLIEWAQRQLSLSPYDEEACRLLMLGYAAMGKHDEVFRAYQQMVARLGELEIEPSAMTKKLFEDIQAPRKNG